MHVSLDSIILYVHDVERLAEFYREAFGLKAVEHIAGEWAVLACGNCQIALHRVGEAFRGTGTDAQRTSSNAKLVLTVDAAITSIRSNLVAKGVTMGEIKSYPGLTGMLCDGIDPEGNVFQLAEAAGIVQ